MAGQGEAVGHQASSGSQRRRKSSCGIGPISTSWSSPDASAPPIWARHYEIGTNRPIFAGRDAVKRYTLAEIEREAAHRHALVRRLATAYARERVSGLASQIGRSGQQRGTLSQKRRGRDEVVHKKLQQLGEGSMSVQSRRAVCLTFAALLLTAPAVAQENWPRFRGADATGVVADDPRLPDTWDHATNVLWKTPIPGWGWGSPIVWGDRVFVSAVHSDEDYEKPKGGLYLGGGRGEPPDTVHHWMVYCLSLATGEVLWKHEAHTGKPQVPRHPKNTYAAETPTTDGKRVYVLFGDVGLYCYDFDGKPLWAHEIEPKKTMFGYGAAASPVVQGDQVIMVYDNAEESYIAAFDSATGEPRWKTTRDEKSTWATPLVWTARRPDRDRRHRQEGDPLLLARRRGAVALRRPHVEPDHPLAVRRRRLAVHHVGLLPGQEPPGLRDPARRQGGHHAGRKETSNEFIAWSLEKMGPYNTSPIVYGGYYYTLLDQGMLTCHDAKTGELVFDRTRFPQGAKFTASPWAYNGKVFFLDEERQDLRDAGRPGVQDRTHQLPGRADASPRRRSARANCWCRTATQVYCITNPAK